MRSVKLLGSGKSGHTKRSDRPAVKILTIVIRVQDGHAEFRVNCNVYNISVNCEMSSVLKATIENKTISVAAHFKKLTTGNNVFIVFSYCLK